MVSEIEATVFVYIKGDEIITTYIDEASKYEFDPDYVHIATLNPRLWIKHALQENPKLLKDLSE